MSTVDTSTEGGPPRNEDTTMAGQPPPPTFSIAADVPSPSLLSPPLDPALDSSILSPSLSFLPDLSQLPPLPFDPAADHRPPTPSTSNSSSSVPMTAVTSTSSAKPFLTGSSALSVRPAPAPFTTSSSMLPSLSNMSNVSASSRPYPSVTAPVSASVPIIQFDPNAASEDEDEDDDEDAGQRPKKRKSMVDLRKANNSGRARSVDEDDESKDSSRRKISIEYIEKKDKRHITFTKRKAGIMKKAYELATLTGTQVLLLVVSESGLVYTFTTAKFQPLVGAADDDSLGEGQKLIQACLATKDGEKPDFATAKAGELREMPLPLPASANSKPFEVNSAIHGGQIALKARLGRPIAGRRVSGKGRPSAIRTASEGAPQVPGLPSPLPRPESPLYLDPSLASPISPRGPASLPTPHPMSPHRSFQMQQQQAAQQQHEQQMAEEYEMMRRASAHSAGYPAGGMYAQSPNGDIRYVPIPVSHPPGMSMHAVYGDPRYPGSSLPSPLQGLSVQTSHYTSSPMDPMMRAPVTAPASMSSVPAGSSHMQHSMSQHHAGLTAQPQGYAQAPRSAYPPSGGTNSGSSSGSSVSLADDQLQMQQQQAFLQHQQDQQRQQEADYLARIGGHA